ncbi:hypothetical protein ND925_06525 [Vibrio diabolicus]|uniref:hypothetical protein n=1 Tax=Vibrio harveyi group TaxID=717610 RepID=UPI0004716CDD|nr:MULTISPECIES: hypothetical protein [Vibrio harveyi group]EGR0686886.1 hypothetical protein [Vibrio parahaemolyticus]EGR1442658.1 hypothetical protein [Vibrio parahaemolyticus]EGR3502781.1 hypothetical protein [Vibrio parahaemolyticus]EJG0325333.1 hypothetical protein [Vibrio parahaemolyticus]EJO3863045.1 hypothetical protein [Vibrio parahaemolyticus]
MNMPLLNPIDPAYLTDDHSKKITLAHSYFESIGVDQFKEGELDPNIQDSDGLVSYMVATSNPVPDEISKLYDEIAPIMEGLSNVVVSAILKQAGTDTEKKHDPATWRGPMQAMMKAFCSGFSETSKSYNQKVKGVEIANKFINIVLDAIVSEGAALNDFRKFLESQGETMRTEISAGANTYLYANVAIAHEIFQATDGRWIYVPKFKSYFTQFTQETFKITAGCASYDSFDFNFDLDIMTGAFMVNNWSSSEDFRKRTKEFIDRFQKANIADSSNYFDGIFESEGGF